MLTVYNEKEVVCFLFDHCIVQRKLSITLSTHVCFDEAKTN